MPDKPTIPKSDQKTVLIIEDDANTATLIALYLEREGFRAKQADNGEKGLAMARRLLPDLVILDLMLPKIDGWEVCRQLQQEAKVPVIMLTARGEEIDRVAGLTLGADDYVVKPFSPRELVARVKAVLRRTQGVATIDRPILTQGTIKLDLEKRRLFVENRPVALTPHEYRLLQALMQRPGRIFTRDELLRKLYPQDEATVIDRVVDVHIGKLRQKIETDAARPKLILTVRGIGYQFNDTI